MHVFLIFDLIIITSFSLTSKCVFLGYSNEHKGYKCLHPTGCLYIANNVEFNEHDFPYASINLSTTTDAISDNGVYSEFVPVTGKSVQCSHSPLVSSQ